MKICGLLKTTLLDYPGHVACTIFTGGCNMRCPFCHNAELLDINLPSVYSEEDIFAFLDKRAGTLEGVAITGGEPTLHRDLPDFIRKIRERYGLDVKLDSNGIHPEMLEQLIRDKMVDYVAMDIKACPERYAYVSGVTEEKLHFDRITRSKDLLLQGQVPYEFRTTVTGGLNTEEDFHGIARFIEGADAYFLQCFKDSGNIVDKDRGFYEPSKEELLRYRDIVAPHVRRAELRGIDY